MRFRYYKVLLPKRSEYFGSSLLKPIIPIKVAVGGRAVNYAALIDSGADFCIFHAEIGEYLGLDILADLPLEFGGVQDRGGAKAFLHEVVLGVGGFDYKTKIGFSYNIANHGFGILGQKGFFEVFVVKFCLAKEEIGLKDIR